MKIISKRGRCIQGDKEQVVKAIHLGRSGDGTGPTVFIGIELEDGKNVNVYLPTDEAVTLATEMAGYAELSEKMHGE